MTLLAQELTCIRGERQLFRDLNFEINPGDAMHVAGINGSGKTSLLRMLCGLAFPTAGEVRWNGLNIRAGREEFGSRLIYLGHASGVKEDLAAWENVAFASTLSGNPVIRNEACAALARVGLAEAVDLPTRVLSQGQRKRVALARLHLGLSMKTPLWILDEPFTALDQHAITELYRTLNLHLAQGGMVIYTTHQRIDLNAQRLLHLDLSRDSSC